MKLTHNIVARALAIYLGLLAAAVIHHYDIPSEAKDPRNVQHAVPEATGGAGYRCTQAKVPSEDYNCRVADRPLLNKWYLLADISIWRTRRSGTSSRSVLLITVRCIQDEIIFYRFKTQFRY